MLKLSSPAADVAVGGAGRFLIYHLPKERKLAIFDATQAKIAHVIKVGDDSIRFAAGMDKLMLFLPGTKILQRWDLNTMRREVSVAMPVQSNPEATFAMGCASQGPLLANGQFIDVSTLKVLNVQFPGRRVSSGPTSGPVRVSADGTTFTNWRTRTSPQGVTIYQLHDNKVQHAYAHTTAGALIPGPDGKVIFTGQEGLWTPDAKQVKKSVEDGRRSTIPAHHGRLFLGVKQLLKRGGKPGLFVYLMGDERPLAELPKFEFAASEIDGWGRKKITMDKRLHLLPSANLMVRLSAKNDQLILQKFDLEKLLQSTKVDYLIVTSQAPSTLQVGNQLRYQMSVLSKKGNPQFKVEAAPTGVAVASSGEVTWNVEAKHAGKKHVIIIGVTDNSGQEVFHRIEITVKR